MTLLQEPTRAESGLQANDSRAPVRILWLLDSLNVGGAESLVIPFARRLDPERFRLTVGSLSTAGENLVEQELRREAIACVNFGARSLRDTAAFRRLLRFVRDERIDLVHAHLTYSSIWAALLSRMTGVPSVASLHVAPSATRELRATLRHRLATSARDRVMRFALGRWSTRVVAVSGALRRTYDGIADSKMRIVHNGIEVERFQRQRSEARERLQLELDVPAGAQIIVTVAVLRPGKGIEVLLDAAKKLVKQEPRGTNAIFLIIGDGPKRAEWEALAAREGIADRIRWAGFRRDVDALLAGCDLFVHPSLDDAFPTVLLEAMAAGVPVIASEVGGIPEIVVPEKTGRLVPPGDATALAASIAALLTDRAARRRMSEHAQMIAATRFSTEAWLERLTAVYDSAIEERKS